MTTIVHSQHKGTLYDVLLTKAERKILQEVRKDSAKLFAVGEIAKAAYDRAAERNIPAYIAYSLVGEEAGIGYRRVAKLSQIAERFPVKTRNKYGHFPFSYFEEAFVFPPGDDVQMLEFAAHQMTETKRWPGAEKLADDFRRVAIGHDNAPAGITGGNGSSAKATIITGNRQHDLPIPNPPSEEKWVSPKHLRALISGWRSNKKQTVEQCAKDVEALLR